MEEVEDRMVSPMLDGTSCEYENFRIDNATLMHVMV
jgi:hypothetical protein